ncbi:TonB-dependent receptor [Blastomonas sp.]|uniref:TonB-dependent receptor n=1 Tax=Blastomonas sp. TaxID=1909299 RepID=UPI00406A3DBB
MKFELLSAVALLALVPAAQAQAQAQEATATAEDDAQALGEIVVTATRRGTALQTTPLAVTALSGDDLARSGVTSASDLVRVAPTVQIARINSIPQIYIRGIGLQNSTIGSEPGVAVHINGVYLARPAMIEAGLYDLERVEVLRGPQGTLYGRNATGGAVNLITARPTDTLDASAQVEIGNYDRIRMDGMVSGPVSESVGVRVAGYLERRDGFTQNLTTGKPVGQPRSFGGRVTVELAPDDSIFSSVLVADFQQTTRDGNANYIRAFYPTIPGVYVPVPGGRYSTNPRRVFYDLDPTGTSEHAGLSMENALAFDGLTVKSLTSYRYMRRKYASDIDATDVPNLNNPLQFDRSESFSQEIQLLSENSGNFEWLLGGFYFHEKARDAFDFDIRTTFGAPFVVPFTLNIRNSQKSESFAAFGQASYTFLPGLKATVGLRYSHDRKTIDEFLQIPQFFSVQNASLKDSWSALTPKFGLEYESGDTFIYASATRGFKAGGFNAGNPAQQESYQPEYVWTYEAGLKRDWFDNRVRTNLAVFRSDYSNLQVTQFLNNTSQLRNAGSARIDGLELEVTVKPSSQLQLQGAFTYLDTGYNRSTPVFTLLDPVNLELVNMTGRPLPFAPKYAFTLGLNYTVPVPALDGDIVFAANHAWRSKTFLDSVTRETEAQKGYGITDLRLAWQRSDGRFEVAIFGRNVFDTTFFISALRGSASVGGAVANVGAPATYGVQARWSL